MSPTTAVASTVIVGAIAAAITYAAISTLLWLVYLVVSHSHPSLPDVSWIDAYLVYLAYHVAQVRVLNAGRVLEPAVESDMP